MVQVGLLPVCMLFGMLLRRSGRMETDTPSVLNAFIIHVSLPAVTLLHVHDLVIDARLVYPVSMAWILFTAGLVFFVLLGRWAKWTPQTIGALILTAALANTSFLGLPMISAFYGNSQGELALGILIDQLGTYMVLSTLGIMVAAICSQGSFSVLAIGKKILTFTPLHALLAAFLLRPYDYPAELVTVLEILAATLTPLALISIGLQLRFAELKGKLAPLATGLGFKLLLGPALIFVLLTEVLGAGGRIAQITIFESAMGPQIGGSIVALKHGLDRPLVILMVGIGIPLSFATLPLWWWLLQGV